ncbi:MAG: hypothetical protein ACYDA1_06405 [Vulcanimicrobiaceae bacterium]
MRAACAPWLARRGLREILVATIALGLFCLYPLYCFLKFGDALAFAHA